MLSELDVLGIVSRRLTEARVPFMLTGSFALTHYATPRMTRDLDLVVALVEPQIPRMVELFSPDFYIDADSAVAAVRSRRLFNLMHLTSGIKSVARTSFFPSSSGPVNPTPTCSAKTSSRCWTGRSTGLICENGPGVWASPTCSTG